MKFNKYNECWNLLLCQFSTSKIEIEFREKLPTFQKDNCYINILIGFQRGRKVRSSWKWIIATGSMVNVLSSRKAKKGVDRKRKGINTDHRYSEADERHPPEAVESWPRELRT